MQLSCNCVAAWPAPADAALLDWFAPMRAMGLVPAGDHLCGGAGLQTDLRRGGTSYTRYIYIYIPDSESRTSMSVCVTPLSVTVHLVTSSEPEQASAQNDTPNKSGDTRPE